MLIASIALFVATLQGQVSGLPHTDFAKDAGGWTSLGQTGKLSISRDMLTGNSIGSLKFEYAITKGQMDAIVLQTAYAPLGKMKSLRFWVRPDHDTTFGVFLQELEGGRYVATASARKDAWQLVELNPNDFILTDGPDDPTDPNGKLDLSLVAGIGLGDFKQIFAQGGDELVALFGVKMGPHTFYLSDFQAAESSLPDSWAKSETEAKIDTLERPQSAWVCAGQAGVTLVRDGPIVGKALRMDYSVSPKSIAAMFRGMVPGTLGGMAHIEFSLATTAPCNLLVQLEERGGGKYNALVPSLGLSAAKRIVIPFSEFEKAGDSNDSNDKLDLAEVKQILILDISGLQDGKQQANTLWLGPVVARSGSG